MVAVKESQPKPKTENKDGKLGLKSDIRIT
jgi:hypothetical protein